MKMSNKTYNILKWVALTVLPAICALYATIGEVWDFPSVAQVVATIGAINTCLGSILGISSVKYNKEAAKE